MGDHLATIDMGQKVRAAVPLSVGPARFPSNTMWPVPRPTNDRPQIPLSIHQCRIGSPMTICEHGCISTMIQGNCSVIQSTRRGCHVARRRRASSGLLPTSVPEDRFCFHSFLTLCRLQQPRSPSHACLSRSWV